MLSDGAPPPQSPAIAAVALLQSRALPLLLALHCSCCAAAVALRLDCGSLFSRMVRRGRNRVRRHPHGPPIPQPRVLRL